MGSGCGGLMVQSRTAKDLASSTGIIKEFQSPTDDDDGDVHLITQKAHHSSIQPTTSSSSSSSSSMADGNGDDMVVAERRLRRVSRRRELADRDEMWRRHEMAQIAFLQGEHNGTLAGLHCEVDRLHHCIRDLELKQLPRNNDHHDDLQRKLAEAEQRIVELNKQFETKNDRVTNLESQMDKSMRVFRDQLGYQADRIRQLTRELHEKTTTVTQLASQLRTVKLREAMAIAAQRRRASCESPNRSPSAHRLFSPPALPRSQTASATSPRALSNSGLRHAAVTVSYPGSKANSYGDGGLTSIRPATSTSLPPLDSACSSSAPSAGHNIEKPGRLIRSASAALSASRTANGGPLRRGGGAP